MGGAARRRPSTIPAPARVVVAGIVPPSEPGARRRVVHRRARTPSRVTGARRGHRPSPGRRASPWSPASPLANRTPESMAAGARPGRRRPFRPPEAHSSGLSAASPGGCSVDRRLLFAESDTRRPGATRGAQERHATPRSDTGRWATPDLPAQSRSMEEFMRASLAADVPASLAQAPRSERDRSADRPRRSRRKPPPASRPDRVRLLDPDDGRSERLPEEPRRRARLVGERQARACPRPGDVREAALLLEGANRIARVGQCPRAREATLGHPDHEHVVKLKPLRGMSGGQREARFFGAECRQPFAGAADR